MLFKFLRDLNYCEISNKWSIKNVIEKGVLYPQEEFVWRGGPNLGVNEFKYL